MFNEENSIVECIKRVDKAVFLKNVSKEIIIVDDGSNDSSKLKVQSALSAIPIRSGRQVQAGKLQHKIKNYKFVSYKTNRGKGYAIREGLQYATGDYVLIQDGDLEYDPEDINKLLKPIIDKKAMVVYGSRFSGEHRNLFFWHMMANKSLTLLTNLLYNSTLSDMEVGYKIFPRKLLLELDLKENCFGFEAEVTAKILKRGIRIYEVPISYAGREFSEGKKITWVDGFKAIFFLLKYRFFD